ncbi:sulfotransferase, partial [bacterium]|nr:sulfotransferase [bacterium]
MFPPEWPTMTEARKLLAKANALLEEQPRSRSHQDRALALYRRALDFQDSRLVWRNVGIVHFNREEWPEAETAFLRARDHYWLGLLYEWTGRLEKAWQEIRQAEPSSEQARVQARIARQLGLAADAIPALEAWDDVDARFELIHLYDRAGRYADAWRTAEEANAMKGQRDPEPFPAMRAAVEPENRRESPVFIIGMPRSGTTLLERMLAQHPALASRGESLFFEFIANQLEAGERIANIGAAYLMSHQKRTVDKYPMNFRYLDLIQGTFPDARIIDMRRDRDDTLISCWFRNFQGNLP